MSGKIDCGQFFAHDLVCFYLCAKI